MKNWLSCFLMDTKNFRMKSIAGFTLFRRHSSWTNIMSMFMLQRIMMEPLWRLLVGLICPETALLLLRWSLPSTIGRKNFVLIESSNGAHASAIIYSLVETAKANYLNVYQYFELLLTEIPKHMNDTDLKFIEELLPWAPHVQETCPSRFKKS